MMTFMDKAQMIKMHIQGKSNREIARIMKVSRNTVNRYVREYEGQQEMLARCDPQDRDGIRRITEAMTSEPAYDSSKRHARKWNAEMDAALDEILASEERKRRMLGPNKQMLSKRQMHGLIVSEGFDIGITTVSKRVDEKRGKAAREAFIAQRYEPGERFEYDFGECRLCIAGKMHKIQMAVFCAPATDTLYALLYRNQRQGAFLDSHVRFFEHMGGTFKEGVYDNMRNVVKRFVGRNEKELNPELLKLAAYYGFSVNVTNCFRGNEKGSVESAVRRVRREAFTTKWSFGSLEDAQAHLDATLEAMNAGKDAGAERAALSFLPPRYEVADVRKDASVDKYSCVTVDKNRYSVPESFVGGKVTVKAYPNEVVAVCGGDEVARHARLFGEGGMSLDIRHYLDTLRRKPGALARSEVLGGYPTFKRIYDEHYAERPKEFIEIVRANSGMDAGELEAELMACSSREPTAASERSAHLLASTTMDQIRRAIEIRKAV